MRLGKQEFGGENKKESDRKGHHKVMGKRPSHLPSLSRLEASPPLLSTWMQPLLWVLLID